MLLRSCEFYLSFVHFALTSKEVLAPLHSERTLT